ncbi:uncharacterized protein LOC128851267 [Cuculus canorus]|uniref:uncharacterized protein LOC128851267 n=1 Tax=Cuculus canorus TaxID=55661 RepID=UPI0023AB167E|nr:uncharacterized protein LOC128851267 [Cuculus canorus]
MDINHISIHPPVYLVLNEETACLLSPPCSEVPFPNFGDMALCVSPPQRGVCSALASSTPFASGLMQVWGEEGAEKVVVVTYSDSRHLSWLTAVPTTCLGYQVPVCIPAFLIRRPRSPIGVIEMLEMCQSAPGTRTGKGRRLGVLPYTGNSCMSVRWKRERFMEVTILMLQSGRKEVFHWAGSPKVLKKTRKNSVEEPDTVYG